MPDATPARASESRCQGRPRAARPGYREDMLCASSACTTVMFFGSEIPVCRIHEAKYQRWGADAEEQAALQWGWVPPASAKDDAAIPESMRLRATRV
jgi:hypothetical protein